MQQIAVGTAEEWDVKVCSRLQLAVGLGMYMPGNTNKAEIVGVGHGCGQMCGCGALAEEWV